MTTTSSLTVLDLEPEQIGPHPRNPRFEVGDVTELADSIASVGILEPLIVAPMVDLVQQGLCSKCGLLYSLTDDGQMVDHDGGPSPRGQSCPGSGAAPTSTTPQKYVLIAGHRRLKAATQAGVTPVPAILRADLDTPATQLEAMLVENLQRSDLSPVEEGAGYEQLHIYGYDTAQIAKATGRSKATVANRRALMKLDAGKRDKVHAHEITLEQATVFVEFAGDKDATAALEGALGSANWKWAIERQRERRTEAKAIEKELKKLRSAGVPIVEELPPYWPQRSDPSLVPLYNLDVGYDDEVHQNEAVAHADCPGHVAAVVKSWNGTSSVEYACNQPGLHGATQGTAGVVDEPTIHDAAAEAEAEKERLAEEARTEQLRADLTTAAAVREQFIADFVAKGKPTDAQLLEIVRYSVRDLVEQWGDGSDAARAFGITFDDDTDLQELIDGVDACIGKAGTLPDLLRPVVGLYAAQADPGTARAYFSSTVAPWLLLLEQLGHDLSDAERTMLPAPAEVAL